ncbi:LOW QUALITY PROTEIN: hypothetical protein HZS_5496 [Henneguya salminicola]|nr:LOW QUALITY PROTEIN: hypothetical protein HZS_5496 [Henneguya salminicola]
MALRDKFNTILIKSYRRIRYFQKLEQKLTILVSSKEQQARQHLWVGDIQNKYNRAMIWATNETLALLRYISHVCSNATFRSTPKDFSQCLAIMTFDLGSQTFEP